MCGHEIPDKQIVTYLWPPVCGLRDGIIFRDGIILRNAIRDKSLSFHHHKALRDPFKFHFILRQDPHSRVPDGQT